jgi:DNA-binding transcriptional LysR family regulator
MNFNDLVQILCVADELNISKAAQLLYMSQPSLSQTIKRVEQQTGHLLFDRVPSGVRLTRNGEHFVKLAREIITMREELEVNLKAEANIHARRLTIGIPSNFSSGALPDLLGRFCQNYPDVVITVKDALSSHLENMILNGDADIAIVQNGVSSNKIAHVIFSREEILLAVSPNNTITAAKTTEKMSYPEIAPDALKKQIFIINTTNQWMRQFADEFFVSNNFEPRGLMFVNNIETAKQLTFKNLGVSFIPTSYVQSDSTHDSLKFFRISGYDFPKLMLDAAYLKSNSENKTISSFIELLT